MNRNQLANCCLFLAFSVNRNIILFCVVWCMHYCFGDILLGICGTFLGIFFHKRVYRLGLTLPFLNTCFSYLVFITILECVTCVTWWHVFLPVSIFQFFFSKNWCKIQRKLARENLRNLLYQHFLAKNKYGRYVVYQNFCGWIVKISCIFASFP